MKVDPSTFTAIVINRFDTRKNKTTPVEICDSNESEAVFPSFRKIN